MTPRLSKSCMPAIWLVAVSLASTAPGQVTGAPRPKEGLIQSARPSDPGQAKDATEGAPAPQTSQSADPKTPTDREKAAEQLKKQEKQRILGLVPNFNTSYVQDAAPLSPAQKFNLAYHSVLDPFAFVAAAGDGGISQAENDFPGYGQGWGGYGKRFGASYLDEFDGTMIGNAILPVLLKQDPRYFRKGTGTLKRRVLYSISTTVWCKNDNGKWGPNYSNVAGNLAAGGLSNLYYPSSDRGAALTIERGLTVSAEGTLGALADEFWPDIAHKILKGRYARLQGNVPDAPPGAQPNPIPPNPSR